MLGSKKILASGIMKNEPLIMIVLLEGSAVTYYKVF